MLQWIIIVVSFVLWVAIWVIPFRRNIYEWYDRRWGR